MCRHQTEINRLLALMPIFTLNGILSVAAVRVAKHFAIFQSKRYQNNKPNLEKGQKRAKGSSENLAASKCYLVPLFLKFGTKSPT